MKITHINEDYIVTNSSWFLDKSSRLNNNIIYLRPSFSITKIFTSGTHSSEGLF